MKRTLSLYLFSLLMSLPILAQQINGVVYYQNSGGKVAKGVKIGAFGCNEVYSQSNGMFILSCPEKKVGQSVKLIIGDTNSEGEAIELVNNHQLEWLRIPEASNNDPIEVIICYDGERNKAAIKYYDLLTDSYEKEYEQKIEEMKEALNNNVLSNEERQSLIAEIDALREEKDVLKERLEEQALFIASINQDKASELVKEAIQKIEEEQDIDAALAILEDAKLEEAYQIALAKAEKEIRQVIEGYELKISLLLPRFKYSEVCNYYDKIIEIYTVNFTDQQELASYYSSAALVIWDSGKYFKALKYQEKTIAILEEILDEKHPDLATAYNNIAGTYESMGKYDQALVFEKKSIAIREEVLEAKHPDLAASYSDIAITFNYLGSYDLALAFQQKSLAIREEIFEAQHPELAISYNNIATSYQALGNYDTALVFQKKAIAIQEEILDMNHLDLAMFYNNITTIYQDLGKFEEALVFNKKAITIGEEILDSNRPALAIFYGNIATTYQYLGKFDLALVFYQKTTTIQEEILDSNHPNMALVYGNMGTTYESLGKFDLALVFYQRTIAIQEEILEANHPDLATSYNNIAFTYQYLGKYDQALVFHKKDIAIQEEIFEENHPHLAMSYGSIGNTYKFLGKFDLASEYINRCIEIFTTALPVDHPYQQKAFNRWIEIYYAKGLVAFNKNDYQAALQDFELLNSKVDNSTIWNMTGICYYNLKNYSQAILAYNNVLKFSPEFKEYNYYNNIGTAHVKNKEFEKAKTAFEEYQKLFPKEGRTYRNWAMYYALKKEKDKAIASLEKAVNLGYKNIDWFKTDDSMDGLRNEQVFIDILNKLEKE